MILGFYDSIYFANSEPYAAAKIIDEMQKLEVENSGLNEARTGFTSDGCWGASAESACLAQGVVR